MSTRECYRKAVELEKERLAALTPEALRTLSVDQPVRRTVDDTSVSISIIREPHQSGGQLIALQAFRPFLGLKRFGQMFVEGFVLHSDGHITPAEPRDLWDYT